MRCVFYKLPDISCIIINNSYIKNTIFQVSYNSRHVSVEATPSSGETVLEHFETLKKADFVLTVSLLASEYTVKSTCF
jgi:hypothetical protein